MNTLQAIEWFFLGYFVVLNGGYLLLNLLSLASLRSYLEKHSLNDLPQAQIGLEPPISLLVPAYNEEATIVSSLKSLLHLDYPDYEIIVINDGSTDETLATLIHEFSLHPFEEAYWRQLPCNEVREIYRSALHPKLRVIDKLNGGKADALNAGINASRCPLYCAVDADSILQRDSLTKVVQPFIDDPQTIVSGGTIRIANGCDISGGFLNAVGLPANLLARFQIVEYLRAFLFGRLGWTPLNAVLIVSGAFGLFRKSEVINAGGYRTDTVGEDMELILRLHRLNRTQHRPYRIAYVPDPICWTEAPETLQVLRSQRMRWQRGLAESLTMNISLLFQRRSGCAGWLAFPFFILFELLGPAIEVLGYLTMTVGVITGIFSWEAFQAFLLVAIGFGILLSVTALLLEEMSFRLFPWPAHIAWLFLIAILENFGYRQMITVWRFHGMVRWLMGRHQHWGTMTRSNTLRDNRPGPAVQNAVPKGESP